MRDKDRLDSFYDNLKEIHKEFFPDWRFGQLIHNLQVWILQKEKADPFFFEEDKMEECIDRFVDAMCDPVPVFFTFGSSEQFPYSRDEYVVAYAASRKRAIAKFRKKYQDVTPGILNCADYYSEDEFRPICEHWYKGKGPAEIIK